MLHWRIHCYLKCMFGHASQTSGGGTKPFYKEPCCRLLLMKLIFFFNDKCYYVVDENIVEVVLEFRIIKFSGSLDCICKVEHTPLFFKHTFNMRLKVKTLFFFFIIYFSFLRRKYWL
jgi:hypothetical protein